MNGTRNSLSRRPCRDSVVDYASGSILRTFATKMSVAGVTRSVTFRRCCTIVEVGCNDVTGTFDQDNDLRPQVDGCAKLRRLYKSRLYIDQLTVM